MAGALAAVARLADHRVDTYATVEAAGGAVRSVVATFGRSGAALPDLLPGLAALD